MDSVIDDEEEDVANHNLVKMLKPKFGRSSEYFSVKQSRSAGPNEKAGGKSKQCIIKSSLSFTKCVTYNREQASRGDNKKGIRDLWSDWGNRDKRTSFLTQI